MSAYTIGPLPVGNLNVDRDCDQYLGADIRTSPFDLYSPFNDSQTEPSKHIDKELGGQCNQKTQM
jgi:hypothetical protein